MWVKAAFIKFWFAGAVFFFVGWGLSIQSADQLDLVLVLGLIHGLVSDILVNRILIFIETPEKPCRKYILCYSKKFFSVPVNLFLCVFFVFFVAYIYHFINLLAMSLGWAPDGFIFLGAEPIGYGLLFLLCDTLVLLMKNTFMNIVKKARG
jgi:hypothetical protein